MFELVLRVPAAQVEALSDALIDELQALSASVEDADAGTGQEQALFGEPGMPVPAGGWNQSLVTALFADEAAAGAAADALKDLQLGPITLRALADQDWVRLTQQQFAPVAITEDFWIVPSWHEPPAQARRVLRLDPGLAFGTGTHPTTRMCLRWLARQSNAQTEGLQSAGPAPWSRVLDYGCGSGILAIAAALHGALAVDAVDIDAAAITATQANALANGVVIKTGRAEMAAGPYPLVLANILATPLKLLAPLLCSHVAVRGCLVLAGILARQAEELSATYAPYLPLVVSDEEEGWILMTAQRPA